MSLNEITDKTRFFAFLYDNFKGVDFLIIFKTLKLSSVEGVYVWQAVIF